MNHEQKRCGKPNPRGGGECVLFPSGTGHYHHRDLSGAVWNDSTPPALGGDPWPDAEPRYCLDGRAGGCGVPGKFHHHVQDEIVLHTPPVPNDAPSAVEQLADDMRARVADLHGVPVEMVRQVSAYDSIPLADWVDQAKWAEELKLRGFPVIGTKVHEALEAFRAELGPDPEPLTIVDAQLAELAQFVEHAQHSEDCYINPDETVCVCLIGKVRGLLPICGETRVGPTGEIWRCGEIRHPETPTQHHFLAV